MNRFLRAAPLLAFLTPGASGQEAPTPITSPSDARSHGLDSLFLRVREEGVPTPSGAGDLVRNARVAAQMGKALFYEMGVGSDGIQSCASCHFHAGADNRVRNQVSPGLARVAGPRQGDVVGFFDAAPAEDHDFEVRGPNEVLQRNDFPFVRDIGDGANVIESGGVQFPAPGNSNDVGSSMGVNLTDFVSTAPGQLVDEGVERLDPVFQAGGRTVRRVEPRNTPTTINSVFNFFNFWDGRASPVFNGVDPFGVQEPAARVFRVSGDTIVSLPVSFDDASLASQAVGPPLSHFEMSFGGRTFPDVGRKLLTMQPLSIQDVAQDDSLLGSLRHPSGKGLVRTYEEFVRAAFHPEWWAGQDLVYLPPEGEAQIVSPGAGTDPEHTYTMMEANFSLFYGIAVLAYERTLVSDRAPFDRWMEGDGAYVSGFGPRELSGLNVFVGPGKCVNCHGGPEFTNASVRNAQGGRNIIEPMLMGDGRAALYDNGFYNIGVTPTKDDLGRGAAGPNGPLASSRQLLFDVLGVQSIPFEIIGAPISNLESDEGDPDVLGTRDEATGTFIPVCRDLNGDGRCGTGDEFLLRRNAVDGAFKTPTLRNVELTGPYFHNGSVATLMEVVDFYDRGGNFCRLNRDDLDPDIEALGLTSQERWDLVAFMLALTDPRVRREQAPFDHPQLVLPNGLHPDGSEALIDIPAVGRGGRAPGDALHPFLNASPFSANPVHGDTDEYGDVACSPGFQHPE
jgi:cytochrome c peroxidase